MDSRIRTKDMISTEDRIRTKDIVMKENNSNKLNMVNLSLERKRWRGNRLFNIVSRCWAILEVWRVVLRKYLLKEDRFYHLWINTNLTFKLWAVVQKITQKSNPSNDAKSVAVKQPSAQNILKSRMLNNKT